MLEVGDGINITVGGTNGLGNANPYDPWRFFLFNVGSAKETGPHVEELPGLHRAGTAKDCSSLPPDRDMKESNRDMGLIGYAGIKIGAVLCPCVIVLGGQQRHSGTRCSSSGFRSPPDPPTQRGRRAADRQ